MEKMKYTEKEVKDKQAEFDETLALTLEAYIGFNDILEHGVLINKLYVIKQMERIGAEFKKIHDEYFEHSKLTSEQIATVMENSEIPWIQSIQKKAEKIKAQMAKAGKLLEKEGLSKTKAKVSANKRKRMKKSGKRRMMD